MSWGGWRSLLCFSVCLSCPSALTLQFLQNDVLLCLSVWCKNMESERQAQGSLLNHTLVFQLEKEVYGCHYIIIIAATIC